MRMLESGFTTDLRSVVFRGTERDDVLTLFWKGVDDSVLSGTMRELEADEARRTSSKSIYPPWSKRRETATHFGTNGTSEPPALGEAIDACTKRFGTSGLRRMSLEDVYELSLIHISEPTRPY